MELNEAARLLGSVKSPQKAASCKENGFQPGRKYLETECTCGRDRKKREKHKPECPRLIEWLEKTGRAVVG